ncbi:MAG: acyltransferase [Elusimicrobia bacterium]|nr:acyltransferase [Elusimicrobiota bacterium]MBU2614759.1 acyltransferase [Elusimicrobiota bacterium]
MFRHRYFKELFYAFNEGYYRSNFKKLGKWARIGRNFRAKNPGNIEIGDNILVESSVVFESGRIGNGIKIGDNVQIRHHCVFFTGDHASSLISIGGGVYINDHCRFYGGGGILIGNNVLIGPNVTITSSQHDFRYKNKLIIEQESILKKIVIEDDVWLGANVVVCPGARIGKGCVIGAGAVVVKDIPPYSVAVGIPAKVIKERNLINENSTGL